MMTRCRILLILILLFGLAGQASAASFPLIIEISPLLNIRSIVSALGGTLVDSIPGANTYLVNVPLIPTGAVASLLGIQSMELNKGVALVPAPRPAVLTVPPNTPPDWYKNQPAMLLVRSRDALAYSTGRGVVIADINSKVDVRHPALI